MSLPTREELLKRFGDVTDPEIRVRHKRITEVLVENCPEVKQRFVEEGRQEGRLLEVRAALHRVLTCRQLPPNGDEDARIEACTDLATLRRWLIRAVAAASVAEALA
jgi:hypothetical protein